MSQRRNKYDACEYSLYMRDNNDLLSYHLNRNAVWNCNKCRCKESNLQDLPKRVDMESDLLGYTRQVSNCPYKKFVPCYSSDGTPVPCKNVNLENPRLCERTMVGHGDHLPCSRNYDTSFYYDNVVCKK